MPEWESVQRQALWDWIFIPIGEEEYDFALSYSTLEQKEMKEFLEILTSDAFKERVEQNGGYDCQDSGRVIFCGEE